MAVTVRLLRGPGQEKGSSVMGVEGGGWSGGANQAAGGHSLESTHQGQGEGSTCSRRMPSLGHCTNTFLAHFLF